MYLLSSASPMSAPTSSQGPQALHALEGSAFGCIGCIGCRCSSSRARAHSARVQNSSSGTSGTAIHDSRVTTRVVEKTARAESWRGSAGPAESAGWAARLGRSCRARPKNASWVARVVVNVARRTASVLLPSRVIQGQSSHPIIGGWSK